MIMLMYNIAALQPRWEYSITLWIVLTALQNTMMHEVCEVSEFVEKAAQTLLSSFWDLHLRKLMELTRSSTLYLLHFF